MPPQYPDPVEAGELLAHFISSKGEFAAGRVKYNALMPPRNGRLSCYRADGLSVASVFELAHTYVDPVIGKATIAYAQVVASEFQRHNLEVHPTETPHVRHVNVTGWRNNTEDRLTALKLADAATLVLKPA